jgi:hypothetical protein
MRASGTRSAVQIGRVVGLKAGAEAQGLPNPPAGHRTTAIMAIRVQGPLGPCNTCWRREPGGGNTDPPERDTLRVSAETAEREKLNYERGVKPLPVSRSRDGAGSANA